MKIFLDTEFNGFKGALISIGATSEDGRNFYQETSLPEYDLYEPWVLENVVPHLVGKMVSMDVLRKNFIKYLSGFSEPEIICDWPSDPWYLFDLLLGQSHVETYFPKGLSVRLLDLQRYPRAFESRIPHNALEDAIMIRNTFLGSNAILGEPIVTRVY